VQLSLSLLCFIQSASIGKEHRATVPGTTGQSAVQQVSHNEQRCGVSQSGLRSNPPRAAGGMHVLMIYLKDRTERSEGPDRRSPLGVSKGASMACALCTCLKRSLPPMLGFVKTAALRIRPDKNRSSTWRCLELPPEATDMFWQAVAPQSSRLLDRSTFLSVELVRAGLGAAALCAICSIPDLLALAVRESRICFLDEGTASLASLGVPKCWREGQ